MCEGCWNEHSSPAIDTPEVREAARLIAQVYQHSCVGGGLHIVVDDFNIEASHVRWCLEHLDEHVEPGEEREVTRRCGEALLALPSDEHRAAAVALHDGYWARDNKDSGR